MKIEEIIRTLEFIRDHVLDTNGVHYNFETARCYVADSITIAEALRPTVITDDSATWPESGEELLAVKTDAKWLLITANNLRNELEYGIFGNRNTSAFIDAQWQYLPELEGRCVQT